MLTPRPGPIAVAVGAIVILIVFVTSAIHYRPEEAAHYRSKIFGIQSHKSSVNEGLGSVWNETLGFERIYVIGLKDRTDKRDALTLTSSLTGFKLDWIDGVKGEEIPDKAVPFGTNRTLLWENNLGSWRGHMNAIRAIIENRLSSALIMEDDMDWDVNVKSQLSQFAPGARQMLDSPSSPVPASPYGSEWDLLWLGHCGEHFPEMMEPKLANPDTRKYIIENDPTVPSYNHIKGFLAWKDYPERTRFVHTTGGPICTFAYALSFSGAQKLLYALSVDGLSGPFDNSLSDLCRYQSYGMKCVSATPAYFFHHKSKGYMSGDSDIQGYGAGGE
ncbi:MAG: hypothetical protein M1830_002902, partial [Pleopsidium flavum]